MGIYSGRPGGLAHLWLHFPLFVIFGRANCRLVPNHRCFVFLFSATVSTPYPLLLQLIITSLNKIKIKNSKNSTGKRCLSVSYYICVIVRYLYVPNRRGQFRHTALCRLILGRANCRRDPIIIFIFSDKKFHEFSSLQTFSATDATPYSLFQKSLWLSLHNSFWRKKPILIVDGLRRSTRRTKHLLGMLKSGLWASSSYPLCFT